MRGLCAASYLENPLVSRVTRYLAALSLGKTVLWCYFLWYVAALLFYFEWSPRLWLTAIGISILIGFGLLFGMTSFPSGKVALDRWQLFRLFFMPFCMSSFSALAQSKGFAFIVFPHFRETLTAAALCTGFVVAVLLARRLERVVRARRTGASGETGAEREN